MIGLSPLPTVHPRTFQRSPVRTSTACDSRFILTMGRSLRLRVCRLQLVAHFGLAFATAACLRHLTLLQTSNSPDHYAKGTPSPACGASSALRLRPLVSTRFQVLFHSPPGVLFTFPSRYWFTIGHERVFSLGRWSSRIPAGFHVSCGTWESDQRANALSSTGLSPSVVRDSNRFD